MPISPESLAAGGKEHDHQKALFQWIVLCGAKRYPDMAMAHAVPNGAKLSGVGTDEGRREGSRMKAEGLRPGVPDIFVPVPVVFAQSRVPGLPTDHAYPGLWIEMKRPGRERERNGGRSAEQVDWQRRLAAQGYAVATCYGWRAAAQALSAYFSGQMVMPEGGDCAVWLEAHLPPW